MDQLTIQYYDALVQSLNLNANHFQLFQGKGALGTSDQSIWNIYDAIPPKSINHLYDPNQFNNFSQNYGAILNGIKISEANQKNQLNNALLKYTKANGNYEYTTGLNDILIALGQRGRPATIRLNYNPNLKTTSHSWVNQTSQVNQSFFSTQNNLSSYSNDITSQKINISGSIDKYVVIQGWPLGTFTQNNPGQNPWYTQDVLKYAYSNKTAPIWNNDSIDWTTLFGNNGNTTQFCVSLVVAQGININTQVNASFSKSQQEEITNTVNNDGAFPFYVTQKGKGIVQTINFSTDGHSIFTTKIPKEIPYILGINVYGINDYLQFNP